MQFELLYTDTANDALDRLETEDEKKFAKVRKTLGLMQTNMKNPGLQTHKYNAIEGANGERVWEAYVENNTPSAYRVVLIVSSGTMAPVVESSLLLTSHLTREISAPVKFLLAVAQ